MIKVEKHGTSDLLVGRGDWGAVDPVVEEGTQGRGEVGDVANGGNLGGVGGCSAFHQSGDLLRRFYSREYPGGVWAGVGRRDIGV